RRNADRKCSEVEAPNDGEAQLFVEHDRARSDQLRRRAAVGVDASRVEERRARVTAVEARLVVAAHEVGTSNVDGQLECVTSVRPVEEESCRERERIEYHRIVPAIIRGVVDELEIA